MSRLKESTNFKMEQDQSLDIVLFGGTFDPPHLGHEDAVTIALEVFPKARVVVMPSPSPPTSANSLKAVDTSFEDRLAMCIVAFDDWTRVDVSAFEEALPAPHYTVQTLARFASEHPVAEIGLMIGSDQLNNFLSWKDPKAILEQVSLFVLPRGDDSHTGLVEFGAGVGTALGFPVSIDRANGVIYLEGGKRIIIAKRHPRTVSSTEVRASGGASTMISQSVRDYISDIGLYSTGQ